MPLIERYRDIGATPGAAWAVVSDLVDYANVAPHLTHAELLGELGVGVRRRCYDLEGRAWDERCVRWEPGRGYAMSVDTSQHPDPLVRLEGSWSVERLNFGIRVRMAFDYQSKGALARWWQPAGLHHKLEGVCDVVLDRWSEMISTLSVRACS